VSNVRKHANHDAHIIRAAQNVHFFVAVVAQPRMRRTAWHGCPKKVCSHFFSTKNENKSIMVTSDFLHVFLKVGRPFSKMDIYFLSIF
jgi:hypothetical protein